MPKFNLAAPQALDPEEFASIDIDEMKLNFRLGIIELPVQFLDAAGNVKKVKNITVTAADFPSLLTYLANRKNEALTRAQARFNLAGTIG